ncbi:RNA-binding domain-containing protein [Salinibaculum rarum]|uniref:RNA-binding domain-containing protein n=1 Tax=Salinibaculum rarum TaxID=3058903 RepID=UPI00265F9BE1|nr:RNA-binding domain-containing protein [Salinibaculum sp. KK48]
MLTILHARRTRDNPEWVKITDVFNDGINAWDIAREKIGDESDEISEKAEHYHTQIKQLERITSRPLPLEELPKSADVHQAIDLFDRVNSQGTDLGDAELALAHMSAQWPYIRREMKKKQADLAEKGFSFDLDFYVKCIVAVISGTMTYNKVYDTDKAVLMEKWEQIEDVLDYLVNFLQNEGHIPDSSYITTRAVLIPLIAYLDKNDIRLNQAEKNSFLKWMYVAMMWSRYGRSTDTTLEKDLSLLNDEQPTKELMEEIKDNRGGQIEVRSSDFDGRGKRSKRFYNMVRIVTRANNPVDWKTGEPLKGSYNLESHHIFPKSRLYDELYNSSNHMGKKRVNEIANRAFITSRGNYEIFTDLPAEYLPDVRTNYPEAFEKQFIPDNPELWKLENYEDFLAKRRELLAQAVNDFLESFDNFGDNGGKDESLADLVQKGENHRIEFKETMLYDVHRDQPNTELREEAVKEICSFANSEGGTLIIGIEDKEKEVTGIDRDLKLMQNGKDDFELQLNQEIRDKLDEHFASTYTQVSFDELNGETVCVVSVEKSPNPVYYGDDDFYVRIGSSATPLSIPDANQYIQENFA